MIQQATCFYVFLLMLGRTLALTSSICATVPDGNYVRSSQSCNSYNRCVNGRPIYGVCPRGYSFSPRNQICEVNIDVDCRLCSPFGIQHIPNPDNCQMYYRCVNGVRTSMTCPTGLLFDRNFGDCNLELKVQCETKNTICEQFRDLTYTIIGNPLDCSSYYHCMSGNAIEAFCPSGLFYNPHSAVCDDLGNSCQGAGSIITTPAPTTREYITTSTRAPITSTLRIIYVASTSTLAPITTTLDPTTTTRRR